MEKSLPNVKGIFDHVLEIESQAERKAYLDEACAGVPEVRQKVEALLKAYHEAGSFLDSPPGNATAAFGAVSNAAEVREKPGSVVAGRYKLLELIGEGGMGVVFMAEQQEPVRRMVALKIIKPGMDSSQVLARFEAERQALALMDHPNIAKVLDAGATADGRPFFVMELVKGTPITAFCDANKLSARQRLELFVPVCQAIQHAHQKGVIHRDIKPSNVLIALYDDKPVPKVIDFGIAKAAGSPLTERTLHTGFGAIVGTPEYMSPEQATFNQLDIDTRSDVYSLGVLLYELLIGTTPVDKSRIKEAAILEVLRVVREEEPSRPSVKLSTTAARASIAATRGTEPAKLAELLRGELDWIVMKSLEKDRNRRYETAAGFARDVDRYLKDELVEARPPSARYRLRKFVHRNRVAVLTVSLIFLALVGGVGGTTVGMLQAHAAEAKASTDRDVAEAQKKKAEESERKASAAARDAKTVLEFFASTVIQGQSDELFKGKEKNITLREALIGAEKHIDTSFRDQPLPEATVRYVIGTRLLLFDDVELAVRQLERAHELRRAGLGARHEDTLRVVMSLSAAYLAADKFDQGIKLLKETLAAGPVFEAPDKIDGTNFLGVDFKEMLATTYENAGRLPEAIQVRREIVAAHPEPGESRGIALHSLGRCLNDAGQPKDAEPVLRESLGLLQKFLPKDWSQYAVQGDLGNSLLKQGKHADAEPLLLRGYEELKKREGRDINKGPIIGDDILPDAVDRIVALYEATGQPTKAAEWRGKRPLQKKSTPKTKLP